MNKYPKIQSVFKRDPDNKYKTFLSEYSMPEFKYLKNNTWVMTEKVDGTNIRIMRKDDVLSFGGRTDNAQLHGGLVSRLQELFTSEIFDSVFNEPIDVCLYGEGYGAGIQKGGKYKDHTDFVLFDIKIGNYWLERENIEDIAKTLGIDIVPIISRCTLDDMVKLVKSSLTSTWGNFFMEGLVAKPEVELVTKHGDRIITKLKHKDFKEDK